jgi:hypothetical protein
MTYEQLAEVMKGAAIAKSEWAGIPLPVSGLPMTVEKRYPYQGIENIGRPEETPSDYVCVNSWFSKRLRGNILVGRHIKTGKCRSFCEPWNGVDMVIGTMMASDVWPLKAERAALDKLAELIPNHLFLAYIKTGAFIQTSKRSGVSYIFRKLRPTIAIKEWQGSLRILCTLCLHPIGFYEKTWAGVMVPTDDVIAHLMLMRGDEHHFWKMANQHPSHTPQSGL